MFPTANGNNGFVRKDGGTQDTDDNDADFDGARRTGRRRRAARRTPARASRQITDIQTLGAPTPLCNGRATVKIRGIVTGIDDLYGSNFDVVFKADSGIWVQEADA